MATLETAVSRPNWVRVVTDHAMRAHSWAHRGPLRALAAKVVVSILGISVISSGIAMLVLPGPGLVVMILGLGLLAAEWDWAKRLLIVARDKAELAKAKTLPRGASMGRRVAVGAAALVMGAASWVVSVLLMGGPPTVVMETWTSLVAHLS